MNPPTLNFDGYNKLSIDNVLSSTSYPDNLYHNVGYWAGTNPVHYHKLDTTQSNETSKLYELWQSSLIGNSFGIGFYNVDNTTVLKVNEGDNTGQPSYFKINGSGSHESHAIEVGDVIELWGTNHEGGFTVTEDLLFPTSIEVTIKKDGAAFATTTSNTVYIREEGTYTAEVKGSGAYVTEVSKVVSGDVTSNQEWKSNENQIVYASDGVENDQFGSFVSVDGNYAIVGATPADAAYIFYKSGGTWTQQAILTGNDTVSGDEFGTCVSIKGDYAVVAARGHNTYAGAAYVFVRSGVNWTQQQKLTASDAADNDKLATCSIDGDYIILGAWGENSHTGAVYIFKRSVISWSQQQKITASNAGTVDQFGSAISLNGDYAVIAAWSEDTAGINAGSAYIFKRGTGTETWSQQAIIRGDTIDADDRLGDVPTSASISGDYAIVGARYQDTGGSNKGSAYIFKKDTGAETWSQQAQLQPSDTADSDHFGYSVSINGSMVVVGTADKDSGKGATYIFERSGTTWTEVKKITASDAENNDVFGCSVAIDGTTIFVGACAEDTKDSNAGAAYVYEKGPAGPNITYDGKNKLTVGGTNYADTATVTYYSNTYNIGTAKTMYVKDEGDYVFKISGTDKYVESNVHVSSVDLAGATTKPIDFDGYNKLTLIDAGSNVSANVKYFSNTYEMGSAKEFYIKDQGTYDLEMSGSNVFALSSNVTGTINTLPTRLQGSDISTMGTTNYTRYGVPSSQSIDVEDFLFNSSSNINPCIDFIHLTNSQNTFVFDLESVKTISKIRIYAGNTTPNWASRNTGSVVKLYNGSTLVYTSPSLTFSRSSPETYYGPYEEGKDYNTLLFTTGYTNIDKITVETPSTSAALGRVEVNDFTDTPSLTFDNYNKLTVSNFTTTDIEWNGHLRFRMVHRE